MKKSLVILTTFILLVIFSTSVFGQTICELEAKIDSLRNLKIELTKKTNSVTVELEELVSEKTRREKSNLLKQGIEKTPVITTLKATTRLKDRPSVSGKRITPEIPAGTVISILGYDNVYFKVKTSYLGEWVGYVAKMFVMMNDELKMMIEEAEGERTRDEERKLANTSKEISSG